MTEYTLQKTHIIGNLGENQKYQVKIQNHLSFHLSLTFANIAKELN